MATEKEEKEKIRLMKKLGQHIADLREKKGLTSAEFARRCDMERSNMARIEMGRANLTFYNLVRISKALEMNVSELVKNFEEK